MKHKIGLCSVMLLLVASCAFGADVYREGSVTVVLPPSGAAISVNNPNVLAALRAADSVLGPAGFTRGTMGPPSVASGRIGSYTRDVSVGSPTACSVSIGGNALVFSFIEAGIPQVNSATVQLCNALGDALKNRFGAASVVVRLK